MKNLGQMMKQAQQMQTKMAELQERLVEMEIEGVAAAGMIRVTMNGKGQMRTIKIDPALANPDEVEVLEDLILAATNDAKAKTETRVAEEMQELTGGLQLPPGMQLPF
jgi:DNA-binding YbaB/EbfC family protein